ncbi:hypothetical protein [Methylobacterium indicum]|uniref:Uncharacterized protein n=1 Tax=Methylobacterium indicum TaxID=1775910 RepID=A0A8H9C6C2_9HYPH|nr:hypothetical protein [Methylobacterium indicum]BCM83733.1 hypothetical protein mvi_21940 [Methylobacterium indicum]
MYRATATFRELHDDGFIAAVAIDPPAEPTLTVRLSDGSTRQCPATGQRFAALLAELKAQQDAIPLPAVTGRSLIVDELDTTKAAPNG